jgi:hypothetical protein
MSDYFLSKGSHQSPAEGRCAMEWVAYLAGEPHGDMPRCVDSVLQAFGMAVNDYLGDEDRQRLRPYLARCIGTAGDGRRDERWQMLREYWSFLVPGQAHRFSAEGQASFIGQALAARGLVSEALDLFDRMLPTEPIQMPVAADADAVCSLSS